MQNDSAHSKHQNAATDISHDVIHEQKGKMFQSDEFTMSVANFTRNGNQLAHVVVDAPAEHILAEGHH